MKKELLNMDKYGLLGKNIEYSFSRKYFREKFTSEGIQAEYVNFDLQDIEEIETVLISNPNLKGLNVTIPYKEKIIPYLDELDAVAQEINAVNTIKITGNKLLGFNTDQYGFMKSIFPLLENQHQKALILGTGGAAKAVAFALKSLGVEYKYVSRTSSKNHFSYQQISKSVLQDYTIIINATPLGTAPNIDACPNIPYEFIGENHLLYDLIYNPRVSKFLANGIKRGTKISNGAKMLEYQAEKAWEIWNS